MKIECQHFYRRSYMVNSNKERIEVKEPRVTVCYIRSETHTAVGIAICSLKDSPNKKIGRKIALDRAQYAFENFDIYTDNYELPILSTRAWESIGETDILGNYDYKAFSVLNPNFHFTRLP